MTAWWRWPLGVVSVATFIAGCIGYLMSYAADVGVSHRALVGAGGTDVAPILTYAKCLQQNACSAWFFSEMGGEFSALWTSVIGVGSIGIVFALLQRRNKQVYPGGFALLKQLKNLRLKKWRKNIVAGCSLLVGYFVPLPDPREVEARERVLTGEDFSQQDKQLLAVSPGYGKRPEIGHMAIFGMTRSGKSVHLITQIARWSGSFAVLDVKGELYEKTAGFKRKTHRVIALSPTGIGMRFDAISEILKGENGYATVAEIITWDKEDKDPVFAQRAASGIEAALRAAIIKGEAPMPFLRKLIAEGGMTAFIRELKATNDPDVDVALNTFLGAGGGDDFDIDKAMNDRFLMSAWGNMSQRLKPFIQREVQHLFSGSDFAAEDLLKYPAAVYLLWPEGSLEATRKVYSMVMLGLMRGMNRYVDTKLKGKMPRIPMFCGLDEAARAPLINLNDYLSTAASRGISILVYLQSPAQFDDIYGKSGTEAILANCATQLYYKVETLSTAEYISKRCHKVSVGTESQSRNPFSLGRAKSISLSSTGREVITPDEVLRMGGEERECIIAFISGKRPILAKRLNYYEHKWLDKLLKTHPAPKVPVPKAVAAPALVEAVSTEPEPTPMSHEQPQTYAPLAADSKSKAPVSGPVAKTSHLNKPMQSSSITTASFAANSSTRSEDLEKTPTDPASDQPRSATYINVYSRNSVSVTEDLQNPTEEDSTSKGRKDVN